MPSLLTQRPQAESHPSPNPIWSLSDVLLELSRALANTPANCSFPAISLMDRGSIKTPRGDTGRYREGSYTEGRKKKAAYPESSHLGKHFRMSSITDCGHYWQLLTRHLTVLWANAPASNTLTQILCSLRASLPRATMPSPAQPPTSPQRHGRNGGLGMAPGR